MSEEKAVHNDEQETETRPWRPPRQTRWWVWWAFGMGIALVALSLLVVKLYPGIWEYLPQKRVAALIGIVVTLTVIIVLLAIGGASLGWTGFGEKKLWDWLELLSALAIPIVLAAAGFWFTAQQEQRQQAIEDQRAQSERQLEEQRAQDAALQAYLDQMSTLLLEKNLLNPNEDSEVGTLARARTLTVLGRLGPDRKRTVIEFLYDADLIKGGNPVINLNGADLSGADLYDATLAGANLSGVDLSGANLSGANLDAAFLPGVDLAGANLSGANLSGAFGVTEERLEQQSASLGLAIMPDGTGHAGEYVTTEFLPALSISVSDDWQLAHPEAPAALSITIPAEGQLIFTSPLEVFALDNLSQPRTIPGPRDVDEWVSWFQHRPYLETSKPIPVNVGGASGVRIDVIATSVSDNYPRSICGEQLPCVPLYSARGNLIYASEGWKDRFLIVDVEGESVIINASAPEDEFNEFLPKALKVVDTVRWEGA